jgi:hypothetical protein
MAIQRMLRDTGREIDLGPIDRAVDDWGPTVGGYDARSPERRKSSSPIAPDMAL